MSGSDSSSASTFDLRSSVSDWARAAAESDENLLKVGYLDTFNLEELDSASHLDVVLVVEETETPMAERGSEWDLGGTLGVPSQTLVYTREEWDEVMSGEGWISEKMKTRTVWLYER